MLLYAIFFALYEKAMCNIHPTCLNYLKRLGVGYVQLMPIFDFGNVDEAKPLLRQYNWGYDPAPR